MIRIDDVLAPLLALTVFACGIKAPRQSGAAELRASRVAAAMLSSSDPKNVPVPRVANEAQADADPPPVADESPVIELDDVDPASAVVDLGEIDEIGPTPLSAVVDLGEIDDAAPEPDRTKAKTAPPEK